MNYISRRLVQKTLVHVPLTDIVYLQNPKVACSTVRKSMWIWADNRKNKDTYNGDPHDIKHHPFVRNLEYYERRQPNLIEGARFFTIVRNPYARLLSAYLNKIVSERRDMAVYTPISLRFGFRGTPSFSDFLKAMMNERPDLMDPHFAPQYVSTLSTVIAPNFVGHLEDMDTVAAWLSAHRIPYERHEPHTTGASGMIREYFGPEEIAMAREYYARDFELFGYSEDPAIMHPVNDPSPLPDQRHILRMLLASWTGLDRARRLEALADLKAREFCIDLDFAELESETCRVSDLLAKADRFHTADNWRYLSGLAAELLRRGLVEKAGPVIERAVTLRRPVN